MRIDKLYIKQFKNLRDFFIDFDETVLTTVLIGRNGTGKSNLIEALVIIFRDLDLGEDPRFAYKLTYLCGGKVVEVDADPDRMQNKVQITVEGEKRSLRAFSHNPNREYLPTNVFGYYSGPSNRLQQHFETHQQRFYRQLLDNQQEALRPLFYARLIHSQFVLLAFYSFEEQHLTDFLGEYLGITGLESVLFVLKQPQWWQKSKFPNDLFWGARGVVRVFLEELFSLALAPIKHGNHLYLYIRDLASLHELAQQYQNNVNFFKTLESTYISELIEEVRILVRKPGASDGLTFTELSEGEQQLLTVLGLLRFTKEEESLFLLDEPDTHLNPAWKLEYMDLLGKVVGENESSQIIMSTHDPIVIGGLHKEQVRVLVKMEDGKNISYQPSKDPAGMGVAALLTSDVFGLRTSLDLPTQGKLDRKRQLLVKRNSGVLTPAEEEKLERLDQELRDLDFTRTVRDPLYTQFVNAMSKHEGFNKPVLSIAEREEQARTASEIVEQLQKDGK